MLTTSFALLHAAGACSGRYKFLARALGGIRAYGRTTEIPLSRILEANGLDDALWALSAVPAEQEQNRDRLARLFACWCVRQVWHLLTDPRSRAVVETAERYAVGEATGEELAVARDAAGDAAWDAARDAAGDAARDAAWAAAWDAARAAARDAQATRLREMLMDA